MKKYSIENLIAPLDTVIKTQQDNTLGSALSQTYSTHSAIFVFNKEGTFVGLVSLYQTLYTKNLPYSTKVSSIIFKPPLITKDTPLYEIASHMLAAKTYSLPVFAANGEVEGVIYGKDIVQNILNNSALLQFVSQTIKPRSPITADRNSTVKDVYHLIKEKGVSRIILVDEEGDLAGIVSRADLMHAFMKPTAKRRFAKEGTDVGFYSLAGEKKFRHDKPVLRYATLLVESIPDNKSMEEIITKLIKSPHNSLVLINKNKKPTGFLSTRDLIQAVSLLKPEEEILLIMKKPTDSVSEEELKLAEEHLNTFGKKLIKRMAIQKIDVATEEPKNSVGQTKEFNTTLIVTPVAGNSLVAVTKQKTFIDSIQEATAIIEKQRRRKGLSREETQRASV